MRRRHLKSEGDVTCAHLPPSVEVDKGQFSDDFHNSPRRSSQQSTEFDEDAGDESDAQDGLVFSVPIKP